MTSAQVTDSILAVHPGALGDVILFGRLLEALGGPVTLLAGGEMAQLLAGLGVARRAIDFHALPMQELFTDQPLEQCRLPSLLGRHDRLVSCFPAGDARAESRLAAACQAASAAFLPVRPPADFAGHLIDLWSDMLADSGIVAPPGPPSPCPLSQGTGVAAPAARAAAWPVPAAWRRLARQALRDLAVDPARPATVAANAAATPPARQYAILHPGAGSASKCWPLAQFLDLARAWQARDKTPRQPAPGRSAWSVIFVVGPVELDLWPAGQIQAIQREFPLIQCPPLPVLAGLLAEAAGFVGNDSGAAHLAAAVGTPTVAIFGPTRAEHFAPRGPKVATLSSHPLANLPVARVRKAMEELASR